MRSGLFITMLKTSAVEKTVSSLPRTKTSNELGELLGKGGKKAISAAADFGGSVARGAGVSEGAGKALGLAGLAAGTYAGYKAVDQKRQELLYKAGYYG